MNYACLMYPVKDVPEYSKFSSELCDGIISEIELFSRMLRIQKRRDEMAERSLMYGSEEGSTESAKSNVSNLALVLDETMVNNSDELAAAKWRHFSPLSNEITSVSEDPNRANQTHQGSVITEEILWEVSLSRMSDTKMFFFGGIYWKASFGLNQKHCDSYYVVITPAQELACDCFVRCEFHLSRIPCSEEEDTNTVVPYTRKSKGCYRFPAYEVKHKGFDQFISKAELQKLLSDGGSSPSGVDTMRRFELKLVLSATMSQNGTMIGVPV